jgi:hypothetical protein
MTEGALLELIAARASADDRGVLARHISQSSVLSYAILVLPIGVQEMLLAVWLVAGGFSSYALRSVQLLDQVHVRADASVPTFRPTTMRSATV